MWVINFLLSEETREFTQLHTALHFSSPPESVLEKDVDEKKNYKSKRTNTEKIQLLWHSRRTQDKNKKVMNDWQNKVKEKN